MTLSDGVTRCNRSVIVSVVVVYAVRWYGRLRSVTASTTRWSSQTSSVQTALPLYARQPITQQVSSDFCRHSKIFSSTDMAASWRQKQMNDNRTTACQTSQAVNHIKPRLHQIHVAGYKYPGRATCIRIHVAVMPRYGNDNIVADTGSCTCRRRQGIQVDTTCIRRYMYLV